MLSLSFSSIHSNLFVTFLQQIYPLFIYYPIDESIKGSLQPSHSLGSKGVYGGKRSEGHPSYPIRHIFA